jgi:hypothetical protein
MEAAAKSFLASPKFAVAGASQNPSKFGYKGKKCEGNRNIRILTVLRSFGLVSLAWVTCDANQSDDCRDQIAITGIQDSRYTIRP